MGVRNVQSMYIESWSQSIKKSDQLRLLNDAIRWWPGKGQSTCLRRMPTCCSLLLGSRWRNRRHSRGTSRFLGVDVVENWKSQTTDFEWHYSSLDHVSLDLSQLRSQHGRPNPDSNTPTLINRSINHSFNQSINQSINQSDMAEPW